jgi:hypothetical protein
MLFTRGYIFQYHLLAVFSWGEASLNQPTSGTSMDLSLSNQPEKLRSVGQVCLRSIIHNNMRQYEYDWGWLILHDMEKSMKNLDHPKKWVKIGCHKILGCLILMRRRNIDDIVRSPQWFPLDDHSKLIFPWVEKNPSHRSTSITINIIPIGSMYGIYGNIYHQYTPNVSKYTIHGSYGSWCKHV